VSRGALALADASVEMVQDCDSPMRAPALNESVFVLPGMSQSVMIEDIVDNAIRFSTSVGGGGTTIGGSPRRSHFAW
jgi:hypothetical protein